MVCPHARLRITLTVRRTAYFTQALTNAADSSIAQTPNRGNGREKSDRMSWKYIKSNVERIN